MKRNLNIRRMAEWLVADAEEDAAFDAGDEVSEFYWQDRREEIYRLMNNDEKVVVDGIERRRVEG